MCVLLWENLFSVTHCGYVLPLTSYLCMRWSSPGTNLLPFVRITTCLNFGIQLIVIQFSKCKPDQAGQKPKTEKVWKIGGRGRRRRKQASISEKKPTASKHHDGGFPKLEWTPTLQLIFSARSLPIDNHCSSSSFFLYTRHTSPSSSEVETNSTCTQQRRSCQRPSLRISLHDSICMLLTWQSSSFPTAIFTSLGFRV